MWIRLVNENYYVRNGNTFKKVSGLPIQIDGFDSLELFLHKFNNRLCISEAKSGTKVSALHKSKKSAIRFVQKIIEKKGEHKAQQMIEKKVGNKFLSPRYRFIVNPTR